ncbi:MAG: cytochrome c3 family protein [Methylococcales bacterium]
MNFLIRRRVRTNKQTGQEEYQELLIQAEQLTIGRAPDQHVQITESSVGLRHAIISLRENGQIYFKALTSNDPRIKGESHKTAVLSPGDSIQIGLSTITVEQPRTDYPVVVSIDYAVGVNEETLESLCDTSLSQTGLSKHFWSWLLAVWVMMFFLLIPISGVLFPPAGKVLRDNALLPDDNLWMAGPLHQSHQTIGKDCNTCHTIPFKMVQNRECLECHSNIQHHVDVTAQDEQIFEQNRCASCHREHNEPSILVQRDQRFCSDCHRNLDKLKDDTKLANVTDFGKDHPEFRLTLLKSHYAKGQTSWQPIRVEHNPVSEIREDSSLQFSHQEHLDPKGIRSPDGDQVLECQNCHRPNTSRRRMQVVTMENHCSDCHRLDLDENDLSKQVPHGDLNALYDTLKEYFSRQYLETSALATTQMPNDQLRRPGGERRALSIEEKKLALDWVDKQSLKVAQDVIEDRVCIDCHQISRIPGKTGFEQWYVKPVALNKHWMPLASFDHASHTSYECTNCHKNAKKSKKSSDILMPKIETCQECHSGANDTVKLPSDCLMCHQFHLPKRGLLDKVQRSTAKIRTKQ